MINETNHSNIVVTEIKNGLTIQDNFLKVLKKSDALFNVDSIKKELIYRGDEDFVYKDVKIYGVKNYLLEAN
ncbi:MAG: hypothetical protein Q4E88_01005 [Coriobacteriia bacterium]|nr:hypothetical protein [Coriobacteriia bacterium]